MRNATSQEKGLQQREVYSLEPAFPRLVWPSGSKNAAVQPWGILLTLVVLAGASTVHLRSKLHDGRDVGKEGRGHASCTLSHHPEFRFHPLARLQELEIPSSHVPRQNLVFGDGVTRQEAMQLCSLSQIRTCACMLPGL